MDGEWVVVRRKIRREPSKSSSSATTGSVTDSKNREKNQKKRAARKRAKARQAVALSEGEEGQGYLSSEENQVVSIERPEEFEEARESLQGPSAPGAEVGVGRSQACTAAIAPVLVKDETGRRKEEALKEAPLVAGRSKEKAGSSSNDEFKDDEEGSTEEGEENAPPGHMRSQSEGGIIQRTVGWLGSMLGRRTGSISGHPEECPDVDPEHATLDEKRTTASTSDERALASQAAELAKKHVPVSTVQHAEIPKSRLPSASKAVPKPAPPVASSSSAPSTSGSKKSKVAAVDGDWVRGSFLLTAFAGEASGGAGGHNELVSGVALDGDSVASCSWDSVVKLWRWEQASPSQGASKLCNTKTLRGHTDRVECVAFLAAGAGSARRVLSAGRDCTLRTWNASSGAELHKSYIYESAKSLALLRSPTGPETAVVGTRSGAILLWDLEACRKASSLKGQSDEATCLRILGGDGDKWRIASGCADGKVCVWDTRAASPNPAASLAGHSGRVYSMKESGEHLLFVGDFSGTLKCHDLRKATTTKGSEPREIANAPPTVGVRAPIAGVAVNRNSRILVSAAAGFWDDDEEEEVEGCLQFRALGSSEGEEERYLYTVRPGGGLMTCLEMDGDRVVGGDVNGTLFGLALARGGGGEVKGDGKQVVGVKGKSLGGCESLWDSDDEEDDESGEGEEED